MQGPSFTIHSDDEDDTTIDISKTPSFTIPTAAPPPTSPPVPRAAPPTGAAGPSLGMDMIINRRKVSPDIISLSSAGSDVSAPDSDELSAEDEYAGPGQGALSESSGSEYSRDGPSYDSMQNRFREERSRLESEMNEKKELLYQMDRLEAKGFRLPRKFTMQSDLEEIRAEYHRVVREREVDTAVRFQRKMLMGFVTGVEWLNNRFDPVNAKLDGWSETVHENLMDYDDIFEELHEKYKSTGRKMAPELRLLVSLSGSAFMFHLTNSMFKQTQLPGVEQVLRSNPELMRQFQQAASQQMNDLQNMHANMQPAPGRRPTAPVPAQSSADAGTGLFGMVGNLFGGMTDAPPPRQAAAVSRHEPGIESVISEVHREITSQPPSNRVETLSISDEEITSIIEDTADLNGILIGAGQGSAAKRRAPRKPAAGARTLNL